MPMTTQQLHFPDITFNGDGTVTFRVDDLKIQWSEPDDLDIFASEDREQALKEAQRVWMYERGFRNYADLKADPAMLNAFRNFTATIKIWVP